jgi:hypothetical protein
MSVHDRASDQADDKSDNTRGIRPSSRRPTFGGPLVLLSTVTFLELRIETDHPVRARKTYAHAISDLLFIRPTQNRHPNNRERSF